MTRAFAELLGPCFKTGRTGDRLFHGNQARSENTHTRTPSPPKVKTLTYQAYKQTDSSAKARLLQLAATTTSPNDISSRTRVTPQGSEGAISRFRVYHSQKQALKYQKLDVCNQGYTKRQAKHPRTLIMSDCHRLHSLSSQ